MQCSLTRSPARSRIYRQICTSTHCVYSEVRIVKACRLPIGTGDVIGSVKDVVAVSIVVVVVAVGIVITSAVSVEVVVGCH